MAIAGCRSRNFREHYGHRRWNQASGNRAAAAFLQEAAGADLAVEKGLTTFTRYFQSCSIQLTSFIACSSAFSYAADQGIPMATAIPSGTEQLLLFLFVIFVTTKMLGEIFERLHLPGVPGEILAGVALGPFALGWIPPSDTLRSVAQIGAIFVLFSAGLETSPRDLIRVSRKALLVSVAGVVVPFVLGFVYMKLRGDTTVEAVFIAAAMVATSIGITARALADLNVLSTRTARIILDTAVFEDVLGMLVLAVVAGAASGTGVQWWHLGVLIAEAVTFALF